MVIGKIRAKEKKKEIERKTRKIVAREEEKEVRKWKRKAKESVIRSRKGNRRKGKR